MRINKFVAGSTGMSRRAADTAIDQGRVAVNGQPAMLGTEVKSDDAVTLDGQRLTMSRQPTTIMLNKPVGYVVSRSGQGSKTIYDLLPAGYQHLKPVGRLDKDSSGLIILTNDGALADQLTHPRYAKTKIYEVALDKPLTKHDQDKVELGITLDDGISQLKLAKLGSDNQWRITMQEGRNRQIRRTFAALGYNVSNLHRTNFGPYELKKLDPAAYSLLVGHYNEAWDAG